MAVSYWLQVITSAEFHPQHCNILAYSSSKGCIRLADMRNAALCDRHAKAFEEVDASVSESWLHHVLAGRTRSSTYSPVSLKFIQRQHCKQA
jgi:hypothetical protein